MTARARGASRLRENLVANAVGQIWSAVLALAAVPFYIGFLGVEAYGLIGFFASLQALFAVLDLGLGTTANREVARRLPREDQAVEMRDLVRTLEAAYVVIATTLALLIVGSAGWLISSWISAEALGPRVLYVAVVVFGVSLGIRWPVSLYMGVLLGAERQVRLNVALLILSTLRTGGAILVLAFVSPTILAYLAWFLVTAVVELLVMRTIAWGVLPAVGRSARVRPRLLRGVAAFSFSVAGNSLLAGLLKQSDRLIITKLLPLVQVGYYSAAHAAAGGLSLLVRPVATAALPRFTGLMASGEDDKLADTYHRLSQIVACGIAPVAAVLIFFAEDILLLWTRSADVASSAALTFAVFGFANLLNAMMQVPFSLQLAAGITRIALWSNAVSVVLLLPVMYILIRRFGIAGAGISWALFNTMYYLVIPHVMHRYVLPGHMARWFWRDTLPFMVVSMAIVAGVWSVRETGAGGLATAVVAAAGILVYGGIASRFSSDLRWALRSLFLTRPVVSS